MLMDLQSQSVATERYLSLCTRGVQLVAAQALAQLLPSRPSVERTHSCGNLRIARRKRHLGNQLRDTNVHG